MTGASFSEDDLHFCWQAQYFSVCGVLVFGFVSHGLPAFSLVGLGQDYLEWTLRGEFSHCRVQVTFDGDTGAALGCQVVQDTAPQCQKPGCSWWIAGLERECTYHISPRHFGFTIHPVGKALSQGPIHFPPLFKPDLTWKCWAQRKCKHAMRQFVNEEDPKVIPRLIARIVFPRIAGAAVWRREHGLEP